MMGVSKIIDQCNEIKPIKNYMKKAQESFEKFQRRSQHMNEAIKILKEQEKHPHLMVKEELKLANLIEE